MHKTYQILAILLIAICSLVAFAEHKAAAPSVDIDGTVWMGFFNMEDSMGVSTMPAGTEDAILPVYVTFGQSGTHIYGSLTMPYDQNDQTRDPAHITLNQIAIINGSINGNTITFDLAENETIKFSESLRGDILNNGESINIYFQIPFIGKISIGDLYRTHTENYLSGLYTGKTSYALAPPADYNNTMIGLAFDGSKVKFTGYFYDPDEPKEPYVFSDIATYEAGTGNFYYHGNSALDEPDFNGTLVDGTIQFILELVDGRTFVGELFFFEDVKKKNPKLKLPKPKNLAANKNTKVRIKHRLGLYGSHISLVDSASASAPAAVPYITRFDYASKYFDIWITAPAGTNGKYYLVYTGPDGKTIKAKKVITIK